VQINKHHITYDDHPEGEWTVEIPALGHRLITVMQRSKSTIEHYVLYNNLIMAMQFELIRMRRELDQREGNCGSKSKDS